MSLGKSNQSSGVKIPKFLRPFMQTAAGIGTSALEGLQGSFNDSILGDLVARFTPQEELAQIIGTERALDPNSAFRTATDVVGDIASGAVADALPMDALANLASGGSQAGPMGGLDTLQRVASGDFLYGGEGFNAALDAAMKRIMPQVQTQFGRSGAGGGTGTLAAESAADRIGEQFALQYGQERGRMDNAAGILEQLGFNRDQLAGTAASTMGNLDIQQIMQQLNAATMLPTISNLDLESLSGIGGEIRGLEQAQIDAPWMRRLQYIQSLFPAFGAFGAPVGQSSSGSQRSIGFLSPG